MNQYQNDHFRNSFDMEHGFLSFYIKGLTSKLDKIPKLIEY